MFLSIGIAPTVAAERVLATYSLFEVSIPVADLEIYAKEGRITASLADYTQLLNPKQLQQLREALQAQIELSPQTIANFLQTPIGETLLQRASKIVQSKSQGADSQMLRSALVLAAADPEGLTILSLLRNFPDASVEVDVAQGVEVFQNVDQLVRRTNAMIDVIQKQAEAALATSPVVPPHQLKVLQQPGPWRWDKLTLQLQDRSPRRLKLTGRGRRFPVDIYLPQLFKSRPSPLIVLSHGLGSDRTIHTYFAQHLASHGFAVAALEHPESSARHIQALLDGKVNTVSPPSEFIDRPLDVQYTLDQLEQRVQTDPRFRGRLNLKQVGVMGHSFGGYTALALGGATLNFDQLRQDCTQLQRTLNLSLLLQCQVLKLPQQVYDLRDPRIKAAIAINSISRSVFGQAGLSQLQIPVMIIAGGSDTFAPPLLEQIEPFTWLTKAPKYLVLMQKATHFSTTGEIDSNQEVFKTPPELIGPTPSVARNYLNTLGLAFFQAYILDQDHAKKFLSAASIQALSKPPLPLSIIEDLDANAVMQPPEPLNSDQDVNP